MKMEFRVLNTDLKGQESVVDQEKVRVGRAEENEIVLPQRSVSRHHATIRIEDGTPVVEDEGSRNETQVDGEVISSPTPISDGAILSFGDVAVQVLFEGENGAPMPPLMTEEESGVVEDGLGHEAMEKGEPETPAGTMSGGTVASREQGGPLQLGSELEAKLWPTLVVVLGLAVGAVLTVFFYRASGQTQVPVEEMGLAMRLGQRKVVQVPSGFTNVARIQPSGAMEIGHPLNLDIAVSVEAQSQGLASVRLENDMGQFILLHVNVLPRAEKNVEEFFSESIDTRSERLEVARKCMRRAEVLRKEGEMYKAREQYKRAVQVLEPLAGNPPSELRQADIWRRRLEKKIQERYEQLTFEMSTFMRGGNRKMALERLGDIKQLIPDEEDVRRQNADLMYRLLQRIIRRENERRR